MVLAGGGEGVACEGRGGSCYGAWLLYCIFHEEICDLNKELRVSTREVIRVVGLVEASQIAFAQETKLRVDDLYEGRLWTKFTTTRSHELDLVHGCPWKFHGLFMRISYEI